MKKESILIATLIASRPKSSEIILRAMASIASQTRATDQVILVFDRKLPAPCELSAIQNILTPIKTTIIRNTFTPGASGAWNTGLQHLENQGFDGYIAIIDDDDEWDRDHLQQCERMCLAKQVDVVLSGLRVIKNGIEELRAPLSSVCRDDFLAGNPGWQGSNTFVRLRTLMRVGGFTDGMPSTNDRDLAIRLLSLPDLSIAFTHRMTASWHINHQVKSLSQPNSPEKEAGLRQFWEMHSHLMTPEIRTKFTIRAKEIFGIAIP